MPSGTQYTADVCGLQAQAVNNRSTPNFGLPVIYFAHKKKVQP